MTQLLKAHVSLPMSSASLVPFSFSFLFKIIHILLFQKHILITDFVIIRLQTIPKATVI